MPRLWMYTSYYIILSCYVQQLTIATFDKRYIINVLITYLTQGDRQTHSGVFMQQCKHIYLLYQTNDNNMKDEDYVVSILR